MSPLWIKEHLPFLQALGLTETHPVQWELLTQAFMPPAPNGRVDNDRLEFLGDEVLRLLASRFLYSHYPNLGVGSLTMIRAQLVSNRTLCRWAKALHLPACLPHGVTDTQLANALEAVIGALYLSTLKHEDLVGGDFSLITPWLVPLFQPLAVAVLADPARHNYKAALQEWSQHYLKELPQYCAVVTAPPYTYEVWLTGKCRGVGHGTSKREAQQQAAHAAYAALPLLALISNLSSEQSKQIAGY
jgi:ribonuclease III